MPKAKLTATFEGVTATRRTDHIYTHVVFGLRSGELEAQAVEKTIAYDQRQSDLRAEALDMVARGVKPAPGHDLLKVEAVNGYHRFTMWDSVARRTNDSGRSFTDMTHAEAVAESESLNSGHADWIARQREHAASLRAKGERWVAVSWHHSLALAQKGVEAAKSFRYTRLEIVEAK